MTNTITIEAALRDEQLLGSALGPTESWATWMTVLKSAFGLTLNRAERRAFEAVAGSRKPPVVTRHDLARRLAANIAKLPQFLRSGRRGRRLFRDRRPFTWVGPTF